MLSVAMCTVGPPAGADSAPGSVTQDVASARLSASGLCKAGVEERYSVEGEPYSRIVILVARGLDASTCTPDRVSSRPEDWVEVVGNFEDGTLLALLTDLERLEDAEFERRLGPGNYSGPTRVSEVRIEGPPGVRVFYEALLGRGKRGFMVRLFFDPDKRRFEVAEIYRLVS
jgi:hypothetical protein